VSVGGLFSAPRSITEDSNQQLYVADLKAFGTGAVLQVDPNTGQQSVLAQGGFINGPMALTFINGSLFVADQGDGLGSVQNLVRIDPTSGQQTLITSSAGFITPTGIAPAVAGNVFITDEPGGIFGTQPGAVWFVNVHTGVQSLVSSGGLFDHPVDLAVEPSGALIVVNTGTASNNYAGSLVRLDPQTGIQTLVSSFPADTGLNKITIGSDGTIYVGAISNGGTPGRIYAVNPVTGVATIVSSGGSLSLVEGLAIYHAPTGTGGLGDVRASLDPVTGVLNLNGGDANDTIAVTQSSPGVLQVSNAGAFVNFNLSSVTGINIQLLGGNDQVTITGVSVPGDLLISAGVGADTFTLSTVAAGRISISATGADAVSVQNATASGILHVSVGPGSPSIAVTQSTSLDLVITALTVYGDNTTYDLENDNVTDPFSGGLSLVGGSGNNNITMANVRVAFAMTVDLGGGVNLVSATSVTALFGFIDGGFPNSGKNVFNDGGGNAGFFVYHFIGH
jgi:sugar lactone lactonase YvrE